MKTIIILGLLLCFINNTEAQLSILWEQQTNAESFYNARAEQIAWDSEGNLIIAGYSWYGIYNSNQTVFVAKLSPSGEIIWLKRYFGEGIGDYDNGTVNGLFIDNNDNILLFAKYFSQKVLRYSKDGELLYEEDHIFDLPFVINVYNNDILFDKVHRTPSNDYLIGGFYVHYNSQIYSYLAEFDQLGVLMSSKVDTLSFIQYDMGSSRLSYYVDYSLYFLGFASYGAAPNNTSGIQLSEMDMEGSMFWLESNWSTDYRRYPLKLLRDNSGFIYYTNYKESSSGSEDGTYLTKLDVDGNVLWERYFDGYQTTDFEFDYGGNLWLIGAGRYENKTVLLKYSQAGEKAFEVIEEGNYWCSELVLNSNNNAYFVTVNSSGVFLIKHNWNGEKLDELKLSGNSNLTTTILAFDEHNDLLVCSDYERNIYIQKVTDLSTSVENENLVPKEFSLSQNYPNPFNPNTKINYSIPHSGKVKLVIFDVLGKEVTTLVNQEQNAGSYKVDFNAVGLSSGIYFYRLNSDQFLETRKLILLK